MFAGKVGGTRSSFSFASGITGRYCPTQLNRIVLGGKGEKSGATTDFNIVGVRTEGENPQRPIGGLQ